VRTLLCIGIPSLVLAVVAAAGAPSASASTACASADALPLAVSSATLAQAEACLINQERARDGLRPLRVNARLAKAADGHARDMVTRDYFSHNSAGGGDFASRIRKAGYRGRTLGEDLAWGAGTFATANSIIDSWMHSPGHRANILSHRFREMGVGVAIGVPGGAGGLVGATYAVDFGAR
jgi:uncharacterized protein YkwD